MPSVVFAEATWYGSLRGGLQSSSGSDLEYFDGGSRWGIKGSAEVSDGLTAVYRFEHKISTANGSQPGGRLAYAGLSGGFGTLTLGQIWNAAYNHVGAITDTSYYFGNATTGYRHGNALSYAFSTGPVGFQLDLVSDGGKDTGQGIDKTEFGVTVGLGDIGKIALAHTNMRDENITKMVAVTPTAITLTGDDQFTVSEKDGKIVKEYGVWRDKTTRAIVKFTELSNLMHTSNAGTADDTTDDASGLMPVIVYHTGTELATEGDSVTKIGDKFYFGTDCDAAAEVSACTSKQVVWLRTQYTEDEAGKNPKPAYTGYTNTPANLSHSATATVADVTPGHKNTHIAVEFNIGGVTPYLGHSTKKNNSAIKGVIKTKTTHYGVRGGLGDTGINFLVAARNVKPDGGTKTSPWLFNLSKNLGGGATVIFEHANYDNNEPGNKETAIGLHVTF